MGKGKKRAGLVNTPQYAGANSFIWDGLTGLGAPAPDGRYFVVLTLTDGCANSVRSEVLVEVDNTPPVAIITSPQAIDASAFSSMFIGSEMGYLFYTELGGTANVLISGSADSDIGLFTNLQTYVYWSSTEYSLSTGFAWDFNFGNGYLGLGCKLCNVYAMAVRPGGFSSCIGAGTCVCARA